MQKDTYIIEKKPYSFPNDGSLSIKQLLDNPHTLLTDKVLFQLEEAFKNDLNEQEACHFAGIDTDTLRRWSLASKELASRLDQCRDYLFQVAKNIIAQAVFDGDVDNAKWILERRQKKHYSQRSEVTGNEGNAIETNLLLGSLNNLLGDSIKMPATDVTVLDTSKITSEPGSSTD